MHKRCNQRIKGAPHCRAYLRPNSAGRHFSPVYSNVCFIKMSNNSVPFQSAPLIFSTPFSKQQQGISQTMTPSWFFPVCLVVISYSQLNVKMFEYPLGTTQKTSSLWSRYCKIHSSLSFTQRHFDLTFVLTHVSDNYLIVCYF